LATAFAGADLAALYITTAREGMTPAQLEAAPEAGGLHRLWTGIEGQLEPAMPGQHGRWRSGGGRAGSRWPCR
jgi:hypothetical protein